MQFHWRRLRAGETDHELVWLLVTLAAAGVGAVWLWMQMPWPRCSFRALLGIPCVTCGSTRAAQAFLQGDIMGAWRFNPLISAGFCGMALYDLYAGAVLISGARRLRVTISGRKVRGLVASLLLGLGGLNWVYLLLRQ